LPSLSLSWPSQQTFNTWKASDLGNDREACEAAFNAAMLHPAFTADMRATVKEALAGVMAKFGSDVIDNGIPHELQRASVYPASAVPIGIEPDPRKKGNYVFVLQVSWDQGLHTQYSLFVAEECGICNLFGLS
jgi:hypothetical protein